MTAQRYDVAEGRPLANLGIGEPEELIYRWLLAHRNETAPKIAQALSLPPRKAQRLLDVIEAKGLVTHAPERPRRYIPSAPDVALEALIQQRQKGLQEARSVVQELQKEAIYEPRDEHEQIVELITSREAERQVYEQMPLAAQDEIVALVRAPMLISRLDVPPEEDNFTQQQSMARGVRYRSIVDSEYLELPGALGATQADMRAGEEVRVIEHLPFKMALADHRIALIPLNLQQLEGPSLLVRSSALLDALYALFEMLWERAIPLSFKGAEAHAAAAYPAPLIAEAEALVAMMAAGLNDKSIAREENVSLRTLQRHIAELMKSLGARTRFQLGWTAALRLSAGSNPSQK